ncbi:flagellin lysine-N-methylase, partial [Shewanella sp.]|uniref:flagellin lysine-N-methylase n=1 Tax=Shewanella sp. TaxID=50422 RepID=UPI002580C6F9
MDNLIIKPGYVTQFQCVGPECEDSCCYDWRISFDKKSYKNTIKHPLLATTAKTAFIETKKSTSDWADIRLDAQGSCPFVNEHKLCDIYGPIRFARHSIAILRRVHCTHIFGLLLRYSSGPDGYLLLL